MGRKQEGEKGNSALLTVIGDVHGCARELEQLLQKLEVLFPPHRIICVGDVIDRGPDSVQAWWLIQKYGIEMICGNHEWMFLEAKSSPDMQELWYANGGLATLRSAEEHARNHGISRDTLLREMREFFQDLPLYLEIPFMDGTGKRILITHAGVHPDFSSLHEALQEPLSSPRSILWQREEPAVLPDTIQVFGHTPIPGGPHHFPGGWNIDTGCVYSHPGLGKLTAVTFSLQDSQCPPVITQVEAESPFF